MTLFILGTDEGKMIARKKAVRYIIVTVITAVFSIVYEMFGHGVYSLFMLGAFAFPLVMGVAFWFVMSSIKTEFRITSAFVNLWTSALYTFLLGFIYKGILDIYGTAGNLTIVYWIAGGTLFIISFIALNMGGAKAS